MLSGWIVTSPLPTALVVDLKPTRDNTLYDSQFAVLSLSDLFLRYMNVSKICRTRSVSRIAKDAEYILSSGVRKFTRIGTVRQFFIDCFEFVITKQSFLKRKNYGTHVYYDIGWMLILTKTVRSFIWHNSELGPFLFRLLLVAKVILFFFLSLFSGLKLNFISSY